MKLFNFFKGKVNNAYQPAAANIGATQKFDARPDELYRYAFPELKIHSHQDFVDAIDQRNKDPYVGIELQNIYLSVMRDSSVGSLVNQSISKIFYRGISIADKDLKPIDYMKQRTLFDPWITQALTGKLLSEFYGHTILWLPRKLDGSILSARTIERRLVSTKDLKAYEPQSIDTKEKKVLVDFLANDKDFTNITTRLLNNGNRNKQLAEQYRDMRKTLMTMQETSSFFMPIINNDDYNDLGLLFSVTNTVLDRKKQELALHILLREHALPNWFLIADFDDKVREQAIKIMSKPGVGKVLTLPKDSNVLNLRTPNENPHNPFIETIQYYTSQIAGIISGQDSFVKEVQFVGNAEQKERFFNSFVLNWQNKLRLWAETELFPLLDSFEVAGIPNPYRQMGIKTKRLIFESEVQNKAIIADEMGLSTEEQQRLAGTQRATPLSPSQKKAGTTGA